jgi:pyruvate/2-oxoglutarate dehydrogenase complex dihydrolipoamide acyltransferase (E2) component
MLRARLRLEPETRKTPVMQDGRPVMKDGKRQVETRKFVVPVLVPDLGPLMERMIEAGADAGARQLAAAANGGAGDAQQVGASASARELEAPQESAAADSDEPSRLRGKARPAPGSARPAAADAGHSAAGPETMGPGPAAGTNAGANAPDGIVERLANQLGIDFEQVAVPFLAGQREFKSHLASDAINKVRHVRSWSRARAMLAALEAEFDGRQDSADVGPPTGSAPPAGGGLHTTADLAADGEPQANPETGEILDSEIVDAEAVQ